MNSTGTGNNPKGKMKRLDQPPYVIAQSELRCFDRKNIIFNRVMWDSSWAGYQRMYDEKVPDILSEGKSGYSRADFALAYASWIVHDAFEGGFSWKKIKPYRNSACTVEIDWTKTKCAIDDPRKMSMFIKRAARFFGASLVGVCKLNRAWLYEDVDIPKKFENVIVMAVEMDADGIIASPAVPAAAASSGSGRKVILNDSKRL